MNRIRTLLVDDAAPLRRLMRLMLEREGSFDVVGEAGNGEEGLAAAKASRPDLMLLDLSMPVLDGLETLNRLRDAEHRPVVVVVSGFQEARMASQAIALGAADYIEKGLRPSELTARILSVYQRVMGAGGEPNGPKPTGDGATGFRHVRTTSERRPPAARSGTVSAAWRKFHEAAGSTRSRGRPSHPQQRGP